MSAVQLVIYLVTLCLFILYHYLRTCNWFSVIRLFSKALDRFSEVRLLTYLFIIISGVVTVRSYGLIGVIYAAIAVFILNWLIGFAFLRIAFKMEKEEYLESKDKRLFPDGLSDHDKELRAEKLAEAKIWQNIKDNMGIKKQ